MDIPAIVSWLKDVQAPFDVIYVSGDTDSFAPPRTRQGLLLLRELLAFQVDLLFTTRALFSSEELRELQSIQKALENRGNFLFGCVSVAQLSYPHLEPRPIAEPRLRLAQLQRFKEMGLVSVLAMRPFLPVVPLVEYLKIVDLAQPFIDLILGEVWYADRAGILERGVFKGPTPEGIEFVDHKMDFDVNEATWKVYEATEVQSAVEQHCKLRGVPFFMRSRPAIEFIRKLGPRELH